MIPFVQNVCFIQFLNKNNNERREKNPSSFSFTAPHHIFLTIIRTQYQQRSHWGLVHSSCVEWFKIQSVWSIYILYLTTRGCMISSWFLFSDVFLSVFARLKRWLRVWKSRWMAALCLFKSHLCRDPRSRLMAAASNNTLPTSDLSPLSGPGLHYLTITPYKWVSFRRVLVFFTRLLEQTCNCLLITQTLPGFDWSGLSYIRLLLHFCCLTFNFKCSCTWVFSQHLNF